MIVLIGGEKGGTGKTTLATNIAAMRASKGSDILIVDTDKQGSASSWAALREEDRKVQLIPCVQKFGNTLISAVGDLSKRYNDIIIDAGGRDSVELRSAMAIADILIIPLQASQFDVWTLGAMDKLVEQAKIINPKLLAFALINRASPNPSVTEAKETESLFEEINNISLIDSVVKDRIAYRKAARNGLAVFELESGDQKASEEISYIYSKVFHEEELKAA